MPLVAFSNVVLPEPFGPIRPTSWPFAIAKDTESSAWLPPNATLPSTISNTGPCPAEVSVNDSPVPDPFRPSLIAARGPRLSARGRLGTAEHSRRPPSHAPEPRCGLGHG